MPGPVPFNNLADFSRSIWLRAHRGVLARVADDLGVSRVMVGEVFHGRSTSRRITVALANAGVPGFEEYRTGDLDPQEAELTG